MQVSCQLHVAATYPSHSVTTILDAVGWEKKLFFQPPSLKPIAVNRKKQNRNSVALVRERTIPTERPPLVGEVSANVFFLWIDGVAWLVQRIPMAVFSDL
jgi:hypothetical protein